MTHGRDHQPAPSTTTDPALARPRRWGFIGAGRMATALAKGMIDRNVCHAEDIWTFDPVPAALEPWRKLGAAIATTNAAVACESDVLILAVKPQSMAEVLQELSSVILPRHLIISVAAGITLKHLEAGLGPQELRLIRVMPNTPALLGDGASGYCLGKHATAADETLVMACLNAVGRAYRVPEKLMDAVTGLSGSGPAFVYVIIEALSDGGVRMGLPRDVAQALAAQTVLGAARMVLETGKHPAALKDEVASPGGTTIAGLHALEQGGIRAALINAVQAATQRSAELGRNSS